MRRLAVHASAILAVASWTGPAYPAEPATASSITELAEILVTARRLPEPMATVPVAISVFEAGTLDRPGIGNLLQLGAYVPNVTMLSAPTGAGGGNSGQFYIRGVGQQDFLPTTDPGVAVYVDGVYHPRSIGAVFDLSDLERVEVLRGPQGALFGKNAVGGAIHLISTKPADGTDYRARATLGSLDRVDFNGMFNVPVVANVAFLRAALAVRQRDGYGRRADFTSRDTLDRSGDADRVSAKLALRWVPTDALTVDLAGDYTHERAQAPPTSLVAIGPAVRDPATGVGLWNALVGAPAGTPYDERYLSGDEDLTFGTGPNRNTLDQGGFRATLTRELDTMRLESISAWRTTDALFGVDADASPLPVSEVENDEDQYQVSQEFRMSDARDGDRLRWQIGAFYLYEVAKDQANVRFLDGLFAALEALPAQLGGVPCAAPFVAPGCAGNPVNLLFDLILDDDNRIEIDTWAGYAHGSWRLFDRLRLSAGVRYSRDEKRYGFVHRRVTSGVNRVPPATVSDSWTAVTPTFAIDYEWLPGLFTYASAARGFKSGGFNGRPLFDVAETEPFDPEFLWSYEAGLRATSPGGRLRFGANAFYYDYTDLQLQSLTASPVTGTLLIVVDNVAEARAYGAEIELSTKLAPDTYLRGSLGYIDTGITALGPTVIAVTRDSDLPNTPRWNGHLGLSHTRALGAGFALAGGIDWAFASASFVDPQNTAALRRDPHDVIDARVSVHHCRRGLAVSVFGTNLTDERFVANGAESFASFGIAQGNYNQPRMWGVALEFGAPRDCG